MESIKETFFDSNLSETGFYRDTLFESAEDSSWVHYTCRSDVGEGYYRYYIDRNLFVFTTWDITFNEELTRDFNQSDFITIGCFDAVEGKVLKPCERTLTPCIMGHLGSEEKFRMCIHKKKPYRGSGVTIFPEYYKDYLQATYPEEYENPCEAFASIDGITDFPEFRLLMRQISNFRSKGISAKLFFASKVAECISLIVERTKSRKLQSPVHQICNQDRINLQTMVSYIENNLDDRLLLEDLAKIALMGSTKLKYTFKQVYKCTVSEFILAKRLNRAEYLLSSSDLNISQISLNVGYKSAGKFSEIFRKNMGLLPNEYRRLTVSADSPLVASDTFVTS